MASTSPRGRAGVADEVDALGQRAGGLHLLEVDAGAGQDQRDVLRGPSGPTEAVDEVPAVGALGRVDDAGGLEVEDLGDLRGHVGGGGLDRHADVGEVGHRAGQLAVARHGAVEHVERLGLEVVVADDAGRRVGPRDGHLRAVELLRGGVDHAGVDAEAPAAGADRVDARCREVTHGDGRAHHHVDAGLLVDGEVVAEEVQRRDDRERVLAGELVGALLGVGRVDGHEAGLELDGTPRPALGHVAAEAAELLVDVLHRRLDGGGVLGEAAVRVALRVLETDDDRLTLGLERLVDRAQRVGGVLAGVLALGGVEAVVGLAGRADAALAGGGGRGGRAARSCGRRPAGRGGGSRRWSRLRRRWSPRPRSWPPPESSSSPPARGRDECECTDEDEWFRRS